MRALAQATAGRAGRRASALRLYEPDGSNVDPCRRAAVERRRAHARPGAAGTQLADELLPAGETELDGQLLLAGGVQRLAAGKVAIYKPRWGAFYDTPLEAHLRERAVTTLVFCGCNFPNCPRTSIYEPASATSGWCSRATRSRVCMSAASASCAQSVSCR